MTDGWMDDDAVPEFELVMPFVIVTSKGGPYDDLAFVAGWQCAVIDEALKAVAPHNATFTKTVRADTIPQLDLIAMKHSYEMSTDTEGTALVPMPEGWAYATFTPLRAEGFS